MPKLEKIHLFDKILSPLLTEKSTNLSGENKIVFNVNRDAKSSALNSFSSGILSGIKNFYDLQDQITIYLERKNSLLLYCREEFEKFMPLQVSMVLEIRKLVGKLC